jgi:hypothetical protein
MHNIKYILSQLERRANSVLNSNESSFSNEIKIYYVFIKSNNKY